MRRTNRALLVGSAVVLLGAIRSNGAVFEDNFDDNTIGSDWTYYSQPGLTLSEASQRVNALSAGTGALTTDALYLSTFNLSAADDFEIRVDYSFESYQTAGGLLTAASLVFGIGTDTSGADSAAIGFGYRNFGTPTAMTSVGYRINGAQTLDISYPNVPSSGTFVISYDQSEDKLYLGVDGSAPTETLTGLVGSSWGGDPLLVSLGIRGNGFVTANGNAWFDNFRVESGSIVPEPVSFGWIGLSGCLLIGRRRRRG